MGCNGVVGVGVTGAVNGHISLADGGWRMDGVAKRKNIEALAELRSGHYKSWRTNRLSPSRRRQRQAL